MPGANRKRMKWVTRDFVHLDRVASPWLILRFIDAAAQFVFVPWGAEDTAPADAIPFALPGAEIGPHDADGSTFAKLLAKHALDDPALHALAGIIEAGIAYVLDDVAPSTPQHRIALGLLAISEGTMLLEDDDAAIIARSLPVYDALYAYLTAHELARAAGRPMPAYEGLGPTLPTRYLRLLLTDAGKR
jgi:hypothetical protein